MRFFLICLLSVAVCPAQQAISVRNAASLTGGIAPGALLDIQQLQSPRLINPDPNRVSVKVRPSGASTTLDAPLALPAPLLSIWAQLPASTPLGPADITLIVDGQASAPARVAITRAAIGLFTQARNGLGPALAQNQDEGQPPVLNQLTHPAQSGQYVILWGTGLGLAGAGEVTVQLGGKDIAPSYAGPAPGVPGVDQVNFRIPPELGAPDGCYVSLVVQAGDITSNQTSIAKASRPGACRHPFGLSPEELATLDSGGQIVFGAVRLQSSVSPEALADRASAEFLRRSAFDIALLAQPLLDDDSYFGCLAAPAGVTLGAIFSGDIDAGEAVTLSGPDKTLTLPRTGGGFYGVSLNLAERVSPGSLPPSLFSPGLWRIAGTGGATIGPFEFAATVPPALLWMNRDELTSIDRQRDQRVMWEPAGYNDADVATVSLAPAAPQFGAAPSPRILCRAPATAGMLTIPSSLLQGLPSARIASLTVSVAPRPDRRAVFSLPLTNGSTARSIFDYLFSEALVTEIR